MYDKNSNSFEKVTLSGIVYGSKYPSALTGRDYNTVKREGDNVELKWKSASENLDHVEMPHQNSKGIIIWHIISSTVVLDTLKEVLSGQIIQFRLSYLPSSSAIIPIIECYKVITEAFNDVANWSIGNSRQVIAEFDNLDIVFLTTGGRGYGGSGMTAREIIQVLEDQNLKFIYNLDGGGSTSTVVDGEFINWKIDGSGKAERPRWNFFYLK